MKTNIIQNKLKMIDNLDFKQIKWKLTETAEAKMSKEEFDVALEEYKKFLKLKIYYPKESIVPSKLVDEIWHNHILDTKKYIYDCEEIFGYFIHHYPYFGLKDEIDQKELQKRFEQTKNIYEIHFGKYPKSFNKAARCQDHPCHVPSSCACREPGTCK